MPAIHPTTAPTPSKQATPHPGRLLVDWVYAPPVGHAIEAFKFAQGYALANPHLEVSLLLNSRSAPELIDCIPGLAHTYLIDMDDFAEPSGPRPSLEAVPQDWDYLFVDPRQNHPMPGWPPYNHYRADARRYFRGRHAWDGSRTPGFPPRVQRPLALQLPAHARAYADSTLTPGRWPRISLLFAPGGGLLMSGGRGLFARTPPIAFWRTLVRALLAEYPDAEVVLLGALKTYHPSQGVTRSDLDALQDEFPSVLNAYDVGILNQLALAERCDLHISPHTGFSFAVQCVGTPWLVLSGGEVFERWLNGVPFASLYPRCDHYPCANWTTYHHPMLPECIDRALAGGPTLCATTGELESRLPEILEHARALIRKDRPYLDCVRAHHAALTLRLAPLNRPADMPLLGHWPDVLTEDYVFPSPDDTTGRSP
jgi:hypothetical protein